MSQTNRETNAQISTRFESHTPTEEQALIMNDLKIRFSELAQIVNTNLRDSREKSLVFTALEEANMWANKAVFTGTQ